MDNGVYISKHFIKKDGDIISFENLGIVSITKRDIEAVFKERKEQGVNPFKSK